ncbi:thyroid adenoma-associated protein homolog [Anneissia japonica]|uniref:thyroid adenoma-associated protein homolog n=1 Tax=Anneissia japonica TaxID=1529436 RepID=UPI00142583F5|nr:thyroid adenoma-associated protein homolog [Anneissia japonica]
MVPQIISPLDTQGMMPLDVRETDLLNAEKKRPENVQGMRPLDTQGSKHINAQSSKPLDMQGSWPLDAQASKSLDYKGMRLCMLMTCLKTARASNITITEFEDDEQGDKMWHGLVGRTTIRQALCHKNNQVRLDTFALICDTKKTAEVLTDCDFDLIKFFLPYNLSSHLPSFRQQLMMLIKKLLIRLQDSGRLHYKNSKTTNCPSQSESANRIHEYKGFLDWFVELLFSGLQSGSCYSTRVSSLSALSILSKFQSGCSWYDDSTIFSPKNVKLLLRCFTDPYESNKVMAFNLLVPLTQEQLGMQDLGRLNTLYKVAIELGCSTRPHNCETASFMLRFLSRQLEPAIKHSSSYHDNLQGIVGDMLDSLSEQVEVANRSLIEAAGTRPMYGVLHCVRELIEDVNFHELTVSVTAKYKQLIDKLLLMCYQVAKVVSPVVCNSSPEGYHPANQERDGSDVPQIDDVAAVEPTYGSKVLNVTPQALLVCCWRSMKEVSLTLGKISQQHEKGQTLLSQQQVNEMGEFFIKLLLESKHRGAFELASVGFNQLCVVLWRSTVAPLQSLPKKWLKDLLNDICAGGDLLCATRRSAGVPFTIQALVTSEPSSLRRQSLQEAMAILLPLVFPAEQNGKEITPQVHALNIMCALFRDTRLGEDVYSFIADGMRAAILGFKSRLWIVRNSSTLLFTALVNRIFGVRRETEELARKNCMTGREFFTRFPSLHGFLLEELTACIGSQTGMDAGYLQPSVFPILLLLSRLYPSPTDGADSSLSLAPFISMVQRCGSSAIYKTRTIAARSLASLIPSGEVLKMVEFLINSLPKWQTQKHHQNEIHGVLLQVHMLLQNHLKGSQQSFVARQHSLLQQAVASFKNCMWLATSSNQCAVTRAEFLNILNTFVMDSSWLQTHFPGLVHQADLKELQEDVVRAASHDGSPPPDVVSLDHVALMQAITNTHVYSCKSNFTTEFRKHLYEKDIQVDPPESDKLLSDSKTICCTLNGSSCAGTVIQHLSSNLYEVRVLVLEHILVELKHDSHWGHERTCFQNVCKSKDIFKQLGFMLASETHHDCKVKLLEVLSRHPVAHCFPWSLGDGRQLTCTQAGDFILSLIGGDSVRDDLVGGVLALSSVLIPFVYESMTEDVEAQPGRDFIKYVIELMDKNSYAEHTTQLRLSIVQTLNKTALYVLIDHKNHLGEVSVTAWSVVLRLLQDSDSDIRSSMTNCVRTLAEHTPSILSDSQFYWDVHARLGLQLAVDMMIDIHHSKNTCSLYKMIFSYVMGEPEDFILEEVEDDKLFDRGEANTNHEEVALLKILLKSFTNHADLHTHVKSKLDSALYQSMQLPGDRKAVGTPLGITRRHSTSSTQMSITGSRSSNLFFNSDSGIFNNKENHYSSTVIMSKNLPRDRALSESANLQQQPRNHQVQPNSNVNRFKTEICRPYEETGSCKYGDKCQFTHLPRSIQQQPQQQPTNSSRYKTELCRPFEENGSCKYGDKCQFAHGFHELRNLQRHPKYKTELCRTFHTVGFCPYGPRCHFIHNPEEKRSSGPPPTNKAIDRAIERPKSLHLNSGALGSTGDLTPPHSLNDSPNPMSPETPLFTEDVLLAALNHVNSNGGAFNLVSDLNTIMSPNMPLSPQVPQSPFMYNLNSPFAAFTQQLTISSDIPEPPGFSRHDSSSVFFPADEPNNIGSYRPPSPPDSLSDPESLCGDSVTAGSPVFTPNSACSPGATGRLPIFRGISVDAASDQIYRTVLSTE